MSTTDFDGITKLGRKLTEFFMSLRQQWNCADNCVPKLLRRAPSLGTREQFETKPFYPSNPSHIPLIPRIP
jgi:hypothetical protein